MRKLMTLVVVMQYAVILGGVSSVGGEQTNISRVSKSAGEGPSSIAKSTDVTNDKIKGAEVSANSPAYTGPVPLDLVKFIAVKKIEDTWGKCAIGPILKCYSADEKLNTYYVVLKLGDSPVPSEEELMQMIRSKKAEYSSTLYDTDGMTRSQRLILAEQRRSIQALDEYCTVVVSADYEGYPIPRYFQGLPAFL